MTEYTIKAETFLRLAHAALQPGEESKNKYASSLRVVRIEQNGGVAIALASYGKIIVGECLPECGDDGMINITIDPALMTLAEAEARQDGVIHINQVPGWTVARTIVTERMYPMNAEVVGDWPDWRLLVPDHQPTKNNGAFGFHSEHIARMGRTSPSGSFVLPKCADKNVTVLVRDKDDPNWFGMFLTTDPLTKQDFVPAEIPDFLK